MALAKLFEADANQVSKALFIAPSSEILQRNESMLYQFCEHMDRTVYKLTGEATIDAQ